MYFAFYTIKHFDLSLLGFFSGFIFYDRSVATMNGLVRNVVVLHTCVSFPPCHRNTC